MQDRKNSEPERDETESPQQRRKLFGKQWLEESLIAELVQRDLAPAAVNLDERVDRARHQPRAGERDERVDAVDDPRLGPAAHAADVDDPEADRQDDAGEAGGEDDVAARPEIFVDREEEAPQPADEEPGDAGEEEPIDAVAEGAVAARDPAPGEDAEHRRRDRRNRRQRPLGVPRLAARPDVVRAEDGAVGVGGERLRRLVEREAGDQCHHQPVTEKDEGDDGDLLFERGAQREQRRGDVGDADPLQHAEEAEVLGAVDDAVQEARMRIARDPPPPEERIGVEQQPDENDEQSAANDLPAHGRGIAPRQRQVRGDADDEEEKREDEVRRRPAVPWRVLERPVDGGPGAGIVDEEHRRDRQPAEDVERYETLSSRRRLAGWQAGVLAGARGSG